MDDYRNSPTVKFCADLFPAHKYKCPSAITFKIRLECASVNWSTVLLISKAYFPQKKRTECKKWKRNCEKCSFQLTLFLLFRINYSRNWECFDQSYVNRTETVHWTLRFLYLSNLLYGICVKIFIINGYISKSYTTTKNAIDRQYTEPGSCSVNYY